MRGYCLACQIHYDDLASFEAHQKCAVISDDRDHRKAVGYALLPVTKRTWHKVWAEELDG